jgi:alkylation response protein AidB-like acyl-CoA dehydrogenase
VSPLPPPPILRSPLIEEVERAATELRLEARAAELDRAPAFPGEEFAALGARRLLGLSVPRARGGRGLPLPEVGPALYALAWATGTTTFAKLSLQPEFCSVLAERGSPELVTRYYRPLLDGLQLVGNQLTEVTGGSDLRALRMSAERTRDGYRLHGTKSQAAFAESAAAAIVYAQVPATDQGRTGLTAFLVPQRLPGVHRSTWEDLGERWMRRGEVRYEGVEIPLDHRLGSEGEGLAAVAPELTRERALLAMIYLGVARRTLEETVRRVGSRTAFGRALSRHEGVAFPVVEDWSEGEAATLYTLRALERLEAGAPADGEAALAKRMAVRLALRTIDHGLQFHGGLAYSGELPFERRWRDVRSGGLAHGTDEIMLANAAKALWSEPSGDSSSSA